MNCTAVCQMYIFQLTTIDLRTRVIYQVAFSYLTRIVPQGQESYTLSQDILDLHFA